ncbi:putative two-component system sensor protein with Hpt domain [Bradyrhizobium sp. STM 3843]|uniref:Hpt domain-containing protein n=1 Tax=unclassified Bradyrhizobium TaxID=2631580 RepID=UPI0002406C07|nr:Hpt domain-containing protein [Bradyrhizobium sp. STM 3843]CCE06169.1 putative two-component system sensor protein with Hpt domain [Bradyrhizobium sp. STM 3843]
MSDGVQIDQAVYQVLCSELGDEDAAEVLRTFLSDTSGKFAGLEGKIGNPAEMTREAHSIKSSAATFGFLTLSELARALEFGAASLEQAEIVLLVQRMRQAFAETRHFAETRLLSSAAA